MLIEKGSQIVAADFLLAFNEEDEVRREHAALGKEVACSQDMGHDLSLVVRRAARVNSTVANRRLKRRRRPFLQRFGRLHIVVPVNQNRRPCRIVPRLGDNRRMTSRLIDIRLKAEVDEFVLQPFRTGYHVHHMLGLSRYSWGSAGTQTGR